MKRGFISLGLRSLRSRALTAKIAKKDLPAFRGVYAWSRSGASYYMRVKVKFPFPVQPEVVPDRLQVPEMVLFFTVP
jgi:hypothetical protein